MFGVGFQETIIASLLITMQLATPFILIVFALRWAISGGIRDAAKRTETANRKGNARGEIGRDEYERVRRDIETE